MIDGIGTGSLPAEALAAAIRRQAQDASARTGAVNAALGALANGQPAGGVARPEAAGFGALVRDALVAPEREIKRAERLPQDLVSGRIDEFHEIAAQLKTAELSFKLALEIRNKLIDAYREVMRMNV